jgi:hypothetical protein
MKKLDTTKESSTSWSPYKAETKQFVQDSYAEIFNALVLSKIKNNYTANSVVCLYGCVNTGTGTTYIISEGAVYCNGEVFLVPALPSTVLASGAVFNLSDVADGTADPTNFSDNAIWNIHRVRTAVIANGATGTGTLSGTSGSDFANLIYTDSVRNSDIVPVGSGVGNTETVIHSFVPSTTTNHANMIATYSGNWNDTAATQFYVKLYLGGTVTHTAGSINGTITGSPTLLWQTSEHLDASNIDTTIAFSRMFAYTAGQAVTITVAATTGTGEITNQSQLIVDSGTL